ncbi:MAG: hypothetical protein HY075_07840 [Deltaproteobacteria bacterium]|nr:hypothetical protein [Deltaproteobacteria bacterium]
MQYGVSYGGLSLLAEYLMARFETRLIGRVAPAAGDGFARLASVYGVAWNDLFAGYARWLFEERSAFPGDAVAVRSPETKLGVAPSGVLYLPESYDAAKLAVTAAPKTCEGSKNVVRNEIVHRADTTARAIWVESVPPCAAVRGETKFDSFTLERK